MLQEQSVMYMLLSGKFMIMKKKHQCQRRKERVSIRHLVHAQCQPCFHPRYQSRRTEAAGFWSCVCVENVFCKVAAPHRYIGNILDQHVNVMQNILKLRPTDVCRLWMLNDQSHPSQKPRGNTALRLRRTADWDRYPHCHSKGLTTKVHVSEKCVQFVTTSHLLV